MRIFYTLLAAATVLGLAGQSLRAAELKLEARLIWGVNDEKSVVQYEVLDSALAGKLHRTFKWKNYYELTNLAAAIPANESRDLKMSASCVIRVKNIGDSRVEVSCIGHGKQVHKGAYTLTPPQWLVLGGNSTNDTAWFIGLREVDPNAIDSKKAVSKN